MAGIIDDNLPNPSFGLVIMNPPYQPDIDRSREEAKKDTGRKRACGSRNALWPRFVRLGLGLCGPNGHCAFIHPPGWRKPGHDLWPVLSPKITYLEMHDARDGMATFGAQTRYDWYVLDKSKAGGPAAVVDQAGARREVDLAGWPWLPSGMLEDFRSIIARPGEARLDVIYSRSRHAHDRAGMSRTRSASNPYPCVHAMTKAGPRLYYAADKSEMFVPKLILGEGGFPYPMIDLEGKYGLTENCFGIRVGSDDEAARIKAAIESQRFRAMIDASK